MSTRNLRKGQETRAAIVAAALDLAARNGLEGLTIGALAERMQMSKSGVFAHFGSREDLQIAVLKAYGEQFVAAVLKPALAAPRGLPRLLALLGRWVDQTMETADSGCLWISSATEYDDRPGAVRDELVATMRGWQRELARAIEVAIEVGHLRRDTIIEDLVFELHGVILALHHDARLMRNPRASAQAFRAFGRALNPRLHDDARGLLEACWPDPSLSSSSPTRSPRGQRHAPVHAAAS